MQHDRLPVVVANGCSANQYMNARLDTVLAPWSYIAPLLTPPTDDADYQSLVESLDAVLDASGAD